MLRILPVCLIGVGILSGCKPPPAAPANTEPPVVSVANPIAQKVTEYLDFTGRTEGSEFVEIRSRVNGELLDSNVKAGRFVKAGTVLYKIDPRPYEAAVKTAEAEALRTDSTQKRLQLELQRAATNLSNTSITKEAYDKVFYDHQEAKALHDAALAQLDLAKLNLDWTTIKAPIDGTLSEDLIKKGNLIRAELSLLTTIIKYDPIYVYYDIDERTVKKILLLIEQGRTQSARTNTLPVRVSLGSESDFPFKGVVTFVNNELDATTGTMRIRAEVQNPPLKNDAVAIVPGMFARVRIKMGDPYPALLVSELAILADQDRRYVLIVNDKNQIERRYVKLGAKFGRLRDLSQSLEPTDLVVVNGFHIARVGTVVRPEKEAMPYQEDASSFIPAKSDADGIPIPMARR